MVKLVGFLISIFLITIIFLQLPQESVGLSGFTTSGSPSSFQRFLKILTGVCILIYFGIALQLNITNN